MTQPALVLGEKVWCPRCGEYVKVVRVASAAKIVDVDRRTIYNYVKQKKVHSVKVAGSTLRVCSHCLLRDASGVTEGGPRTNVSTCTARVAWSVLSTRMFPIVCNGSLERLSAELDEDQNRKIAISVRFFTSRFFKTYLKDRDTLHI